MCEGVWSGMCVCVCVCVCVGGCECVRHVCMRVSVCMFVWYMGVCVCECMYVCVCVPANMGMDGHW